jgi:hypothetical protein
MRGLILRRTFREAVGAHRQFAKDYALAKIKNGKKSFLPFCWFQFGDFPELVGSVLQRPLQAYHRLLFILQEYGVVAADHLEACSFVKSLRFLEVFVD